MRVNSCTMFYQPISNTCMHCNLHVSRQLANYLLKICGPKQHLIGLTPTKSTSHETKIN